MSSSANLSRRVSQLETMVGPADLGPVVMVGPGESAEAALADYERRYGKKEGEPVIIRLVPGAANSGTDNTAEKQGARVS